MSSELSSIDFSQANLVLLATNTCLVAQDILVYRYALAFEVGDIRCVVCCIDRYSDNFNAIFL